MLKISAIIISYAFAAFVLFGVYNTIKKRCKKDKQEEDTVCCIGCKNLAYWNDGSPMCVKDIDHACITSGFKLREPEE